MRTGEANAIGRRRSGLLAAVLSLCLIGLAGPAAAAAQHLTTRRGDAILAAAADVARTARTVPERLAPVHRSSLGHHVPASASLPAAVLVAFMLAVRVSRRRAIGAALGARLPATAGRGPPNTS